MDCPVQAPVRCGGGPARQAQTLHMLTGQPNRPLHVSAQVSLSLATRARQGYAWWPACTCFCVRTALPCA